MIRLMWRCKGCGSKFATQLDQCLYCKTRPLIYDDKAYTVKTVAPSVLPVKVEKRKKLPKEPSKPRPARTLNVKSVPRFESRLPTFDRALGSIEERGAVLGAAYAIYGVPGSGKSTLLLQAYDMASGFYFTGEESAYSIAARAQRLGSGGKINVMRATSLDEVEENASPRARVIICDSAQEISLARQRNSIEDLRQVGDRLREIAIRRSCIVWIVVHSTKEEGMAGPQTLAHSVDAVVSLTVKKGKRYLTLDKNRFGEAYIDYPYAMTSNGIVFALVSRIHTVTRTSYPSFLSFSTG